MKKYYLGINSSHDASACLFRNNTLVSAIEEERLAKDKHSICYKISNSHSGLVKTMPYLSIYYVLQQAGIALDEVDKVYVNDCDLMGFSDIKETEKSVRMMLPIKNREKIVFIPPSDHHLIHAYNAYYLSPFKESVILVVDAFVDADEKKERSFESIFYAKNNKIEEVYSRLAEAGEMGIGSFFQFFCKLLNFDTMTIGRTTHNYFGIGHDESGKLMGLASHGRPFFTDTIVKRKNGRLSIRIKDLYKFALKYKLVKKVTDPESFDKIYMDVKQQLLVPREIFSDYRDEFTQDLAYFAQKQLEEAMFILIEIADKIKRTNNLCISGGVALNCLANGKIKEKYKKKSLYIPFAPADNGNAIGACFFAYANDGKSEKKFNFNNLSPFLGKKYVIGLSDVISIAQKTGLSIKENDFFFEKAEKNKLAKKIAEFLCKDMVVAFIAGGSEFGPRALGHRSILANPFNRATKEYLNSFIKKREWFRPFAPVVLSTHKDLYFKTYGIEKSDMSFTVPLRPKFSYLSAVKNNDGTSRLQIIDATENSLLVKIIKKFGQMTGVSLLLNTSCNLKGLPIIEYPLEIFELYREMPVDVIVIDNMLIIPRYDIFQEFLRYKENTLDEEARERLADRFFKIGNYYRAQCIYEDIFLTVKTPYLLLKMFKSLFSKSMLDKAGQIFSQLNDRKQFFLNGNCSKDICDEYRIYMGIYVIYRCRNNQDCFGLIDLIALERDGQRRAEIADKCIEALFYFSRLFGREILLLKFHKNKNHLTEKFISLLFKHSSKAINIPAFQELMFKSG